MSVTGNKGTNAGNYTASVTSKTGQWSDGSTAPVTVSWRIKKANPSSPTLPTNLEGVTGNPLSSITLPSGYRWVNGSRTIDSGTTSYPAIYNPDSNNYNDLSVNLSVKGNSAVTHPVKPTNLSAVDNLTYNGREQTVTINNFNSSTMVVTGDKGTNAGRYTAYVTSNTGQWSDGTSTPVAVSWRIKKINASSPTLPTSLEGTVGQPLSTITLPTGYSWEDGNRKIDPGTNTYWAIYNPNSTNYNDLEVRLSVKGSERQGGKDAIPGDSESGKDSSGGSGSDTGGSKSGKAGAPDTGAGSTSGFAKIVGGTFIAIATLVIIIVASIKKHHGHKVDFSR